MLKKSSLIFEYNFKNVKWTSWNKISLTSHNADKNDSAYRKKPKALPDQ